MGIFLQRYVGHIIMNTEEKELRDIKDVLQHLFLNYNSMCEKLTPLGVGWIAQQRF